MTQNRRTFLEAATTLAATSLLPAFPVYKEQWPLQAIPNAARWLGSRLA